MRTGICLTCNKIVQQDIDSCINHDHEIIVIENNKIVYVPDEIRYKEYPASYLAQFLQLIPMDLFHLRHVLREYMLKEIDKEYDKFIKLVIENYGV